MGEIACEDDGLAGPCMVLWEELLTKLFPYKCVDKGSCSTWFLKTVENRSCLFKMRRKSVKMHILTCERGAQHPFAARNIQHKSAMSWVADFLDLDNYFEPKCKSSKCNP